MKVYHYSRLDKWEDIENGSWESKNKPGLATNNRMGHADNEAYNCRAVFALLDPLPSTWVYNPHFIQIWSHLKRHVGRLLLEIDIDPKKDPVFVIDRAHVEGHLYKEKEGIPEKYLHGSLAEAEGAYMKSKIALGDYLNNTEGQAYSLPEVIITKQVPLKKIKISEEQPFIDEDLEIYTEA